MRRVDDRFEGRIAQRREDDDKFNVSSGEDFATQQNAGISALLAIATEVTFAISEATTAVIPLSIPVDPKEERDGRNGQSGKIDGQSKEDSAGERPRAGLIGRLRGNHLARSSLSLMFNSGIQAILGFTFWIVMARLYNPAEVGTASSLISATNLIAYFALFGMNTTLVRYLPHTDDPNSLITSIIALVAGTAAVIALVYTLLTPITAPTLAFIDRSPALAGGFILLAAVTAVNLLTDSVFIASRRASLCALTDGIVGGISKLLFGVVLAGTGAYGLYCASTGGFVAAAVASLVLMAITLHWRPSLKNPFGILKPLLKFSGANYVANSLVQLPNVVVPIIVLDRLGAQNAGYYFVAYQMGSILYAAVSAVENSFMAEGSKPGADWRAIRRRSRKLAVMLFVPGGAILAVSANWILLGFGAGYREHALVSLELFAANVVPIAICNWAWTVLRLVGRLRTLMITAAIYASTICGFAWILAPHGITALTVAWPIGCTLAGILATLGTIMKPDKSATGGSTS